VFCKSWFVLFPLAIVLSIEYGRSWVRAPIVANQRLYNWYLLLLR
jgi:hypothetical protein